MFREVVSLNTAFERNTDYIEQEIKADQKRKDKAEIKNKTGENRI